MSYQVAGYPIGGGGGRESTLQRTGESIIYSNDYADQMNRPKRFTQDQGEQQRGYGGEPSYQQQNYQQQQQGRGSYNQSQNIQSQYQYPPSYNPLKSAGQDYGGSLQKEQRSAKFQDDRDRQYQANSFALAEQVNGRRWERMTEERVRPIQYLPQSEILEQNEQEISEKMMSFQEKASQDIVRFQFEPTNGYNRNGILYHELNKAPNSYKWQPSGDWKRGRPDLDMLKFAYKKEEEVFDQFGAKLRQNAEDAMRSRDAKYLEMMMLRERMEHNDRMRAIYGEKKDSDKSEQLDIDQVNWKDVLRYGVGYDIPLKQLETDSRLVGMDYVVDQKEVQRQDEEDNLEQVLEKLQQEESEREDGVGDISSISKRKGQLQQQQQLPSSKVNLNQSQFTEYNLLNQLEENDKETKKSVINNNLQQEAEIDLSHIQMDQKGDVANLDISNIEHKEIGENNNMEGFVGNMDQTSQNLIEKDEEIPKKKKGDDGQYDSIPQSQQNKLSLKNKLTTLSINQQQEKINQHNQNYDQKNQPTSSQNAGRYSSILNSDSNLPQISDTNRNNPNGIDYDKLNSFPKRKRASMKADVEKLDQSGDDFKDIDRILDDIGGIMSEHKMESGRERQIAEMPYQSEKIKHQMQIDKLRVISKINAVDEYNLGRNNPYQSGALQNKERAYKNVGKADSRDTFYSASNNVDLLISQLVQERQLF